MRVLILSDGCYPFVLGGMQKHTYYLVKYLAEKGHKVTLMHCVHTGAIPNNDAFIETTDFSTAADIESICLRFPKSVRFPGHYIYQSYIYSKQLYANIEPRLSEFDLVYIQGFAGWYTLKALAKSTSKAKVVVNFHGLEMYQANTGIKSKLQALLLRPFVRKNLNRAPLIHSLGGNISQLLIKRLNIDSNKIITVPIGIEKKWIADELSVRNKTGIHLAFVGRNERRKGFPELLEAFDRVGVFKNMVLHIVGPFEKTTSTNLIFHGQLKEEYKIIEVLDHCDVLVCPSYAEGMPTVILEAMSRGCAIIATNVGAINELVDENNGWLIPHGSVKALTEALTQAHDTSKPELAKMSRASRNKIARGYTWDIVINLLLDKIYASK